MGALKTSWVNAAAGMHVVEKMFNVVAGAANKVTQAMRDQGKFFSAVKDDMALAAVQIGMSVTDGMIEPMALAKQANLLMRGDLKLSQDQFNAFAKAAVEIGRATGEDTEAIFDRLTKGALKGSVEAMEEYGMRVDSTGTKQQRSSRIIEEITKRYGGLSIAAQDAGEVMDSTANKTELQLLQTARQMDGLTQTLTKFKDYYVSEFLAGGIDALFGTTMSRSNQAAQLMENLRQSTSAAMGETNRLFLEQMRLADLLGTKVTVPEKLRKKALEDNIEVYKKINKELREFIEISQATEYDTMSGERIEGFRKAKAGADDLLGAVRRIADQGIRDEDTLNRRIRLGAEMINAKRAEYNAAVRAKEEAARELDLANANKVTGDKLVEIRWRYADASRAVANLSGFITEQNRQQEALQSALAKNIETKLLPGLKDVLSIMKAMGMKVDLPGDGNDTKADKSTKEAKKRAEAAATEVAKVEYEARKQRMIDQAAQNQHDDDLLLESLRKKKQYQKASIDDQAKMERKELADFYGIKLEDLNDFLQKRNAAIADAYRAEKTMMEEAVAAERERRDQATRESQASDLDYEKTVMDYRSRRVEDRLNKEIASAKTAAEAIAAINEKYGEKMKTASDKELIEMEYNKEKEIDTIKDKFAQKDLERRKAMIAAVKDTTIEASNVMLQALTADAKAREGLSKTEYLMKQLSAWMKGQAMKHAAQSLGSLAEAAAASYLNPAAVPLALKAAALHAAAATAFGGASAAASAMAGSGKSSGSSSSSASSTTQREAVGGTAEQSRGTINIVIGGRGVLFGNPDELARKLSEIMNSANRRGRI
jgi:hypothetical protein